MIIEQTRTLFTIDSLEGRAKERALDWVREGGPWVWQCEWWDSAQAFARIAPIDIAEADYGRRIVSAEWTGDDSVEALSGIRAAKWLINNGWEELAHKNAQGGCTLTGYCGDCPLFDVIVKYLANDWRRIPDLGQVFYECAQEWVNAAADDCEHAYSDEYCGELAEINELLFDEDGAFAGHA
jgi:hypothetical protein